MDCQDFLKSADRYLIGAVLLVTVSCVRAGPEILEPVPEPMPQRLLPLSIGLEQSLVRSEIHHGVTVQTDFATVFGRDLDANVFAEDTVRWGYIELRITFDDRKITGGGVALIAGNMVTLFVPWLFGAPLTIKERIMQAEVAIYDSRRVPVRIFVLDQKVKYPAQRLYEAGSYRDDRRAGIEMARRMMHQFREILAEDMVTINRRLRQAGPISVLSPASAPGSH